MHEASLPDHVLSAPVKTSSRGQDYQKATINTEILGFLLSFKSFLQKRLLGMQIKFCHFNHSDYLKIHPSLLSSLTFETPFFNLDLEIPSS